jgi:hypothetical protein
MEMPLDKVQKVLKIVKEPFRSKHRSAATRRKARSATSLRTNWRHTGRGGDAR